mmetsp:Transcript_15093/g.45250  ORF Transcript_15093/g.45250 Transcript_15093/m.45250 type:complete len:205 (-) Transcript_15093:261-875(-)
MMRGRSALPPWALWTASRSSCSSSTSVMASGSTPTCWKAAMAAIRHTGSGSAMITSRMEGSNGFQADSLLPIPVVHHCCRRVSTSSRNLVLKGFGSTTWKLPLPSSTMTCRWMEEMQTTKGSRLSRRFLTSSWICRAHSRPSMPGILTSRSTSSGFEASPSVCRRARCSRASRPFSASQMRSRQKPTFRISRIAVSRKTSSSSA